MAEETKTATAPPSPAPETKPAETPPAPPPPEVAAVDDPILGPLAQELLLLVDGRKKKDELVVPEIKPVPDGTPPPPPAPAADGDGKIKPGVRERPDPRKVAEEVFDRRMAEARPAAPAPPLPPAPPEAPKYDESKLAQEQQDELADARHAEKIDPSKKGLSDAFLAFYREVDEYLEKHKGDEERTFDEDDEEFMKFLGEREPRWSAGDRQKAQRARLIEETREATRREIEPELRKVQLEAREARLIPAIDKEVAAFGEGIGKELKSDDPMQQEIYQPFAASAEEMARMYLRLINGLDTLGTHNPQQIRDRHDWLIDFVTQQAQIFKTHGGDARKRDGRVFVTPLEYSQITASRDRAKEDKAWTFQPGDVLRMIGVHAVELAKAKAKAEEERMLKYGYSRNKTPAQGTTPAEEPKPSAGIKASTTPAPGPGNAAETLDIDHPGKSIISVLGLQD